MTTTGNCVPGDLIHFVDHLFCTAVNAENIREWTAKDPVLSQVKRHTPLDAQVSEELKAVPGPFNRIEQFGWMRVARKSCHRTTSRL